MPKSSAPPGEAALPEEAPSENAANAVLSESAAGSVGMRESVAVPKSFGQSLLATRYLLGSRGVALLEGLPRPLESSRYALLLMHEDRQERASALASPVRQLLEELQARHWR